MNKKYKISIIGAGNGGCSMAGHFGILGHDVCLYSRDFEKIESIKRLGGINLIDALDGFGKVNIATTDLEKAILHAQIIMIATTADAHKDIAERIVPHLQENQIVVLNPGRTLGAFEFKSVFEKFGLRKRVFLAEAQSLIYACRKTSQSEVRVIGVKDKVMLSALPASDTKHVCEILNSIYSCFTPAFNVLETSLENIGAIFHPSVVLFNAATIERGQDFYFYNDMTPQIAHFIEQLDKERLAIGKAFGLNLISAIEWISYAYPNNIAGDDLCSKMQNNPAYYKILAPNTLYSRHLLEDIPTGILPMLELTRLVNVETPLMNSIYVFTEHLLQQDFKEKGRTLKNLGIEHLSKEEFLAYL